MRSPRLGCFTENFHLFLAFNWPGVSKCAPGNPKRLGNRTESPMYRVSGTISLHSQPGLRNCAGCPARSDVQPQLCWVSSPRTSQERFHRMSDCVDEISREFGIGRDFAENDVREFLQKLKKRPLVEEHEPGMVVSVVIRFFA